MILDELYGTSPLMPNSGASKYAIANINYKNDF